MIANLNGFKIKGRCFTEETNFPTILQRNINLIYGRNGSGKSTISRALAAYCNTDTETLDFFLNFNESCEDISKDTLFVFNEDYIDKTVRINGNGLNTFVMLGEQASLDDEIKTQKELLRIETDKRDEKIAAISLLNDKNNESSPFALFNGLHEKLHGSNDWAERDCGIKGNKTKTAVTPSLIEELHSIEIAEIKDISYAKAVLQKEIDFYVQSRDTMSPPAYLRTLSIPTNQKTVESLLSKSIPKPEMDERDVQIINLLTSSHNYLNDAKTYFESIENNYCPFCLQPVGDDYRVHLTTKLEELLRQESENFKRELQVEKNKLSGIILPFFSEQVKTIFKSEIEKLATINNEINIEIAQIRSKISARENDLYSIPETDIHFNLDALITSYNKQIEDINSKITEIIDFSKNKAKRQKELIFKNKQIAAKEHSFHISSYLNSCKKLEELKREHQNSLNRITEIQNEIGRLNQQKEQTHLPLEIINDILSFIFFDERRIRLESSEGCYLLKINDSDIKPEQVSVGERNAIALSYFFASIGEGKRPQDRYKSPLLIVLDDPISSFDSDNRIGMLTTLRWQIATALNDCHDTKFLIFSHDITTIQGLCKLADDLIVKQKYQHGERSCSLHKLENQILTCIFDITPNLQKVIGWGEYADLLKTTYTAATTNTPQTSHELKTVGNTVRKLLEAYASFVYATNANEMLLKEHLLDTIPDEEKTVFINCMARLILDGESHTYAQARAFTLNEQVYTTKERRRIAKLALKFLYYINKEHLLAYMQPEQVEKIKLFNVTPSRQ